MARGLGLTPPVTLQPQYNLLVRDIEHEIVPACLDAGMGLLPWSPLGGGWLAGKYARDVAPTGATRLGENPERGMEAYEARNADARTWRVIDAVAAVAQARGISQAEVALAWVRARPAVTSVILGARTTAQLAENLKAADLVLDAAETEALDAASEPEAGDLSLRAAGDRPAPPQDRGRPLKPRGGGIVVTFIFRGSLLAAATALAPRRAGLGGRRPLRERAHLRRHRLDALGAVERAGPGQRHRHDLHRARSRPRERTRIDGGGRTLMPGLIDAHWHAMLVRPTPAQSINGDVGYQQPHRRRRGDGHADARLHHRPRHGRAGLRAEAGDRRRRRRGPAHLSFRAR